MKEVHRKGTGDGSGTLISYHGKLYLTPYCNSVQDYSIDYIIDST